MKILETISTILFIVGGCGLDSNFKLAAVMIVAGFAGMWVTSHGA